MRLPACAVIFFLARLSRTNAAVLAPAVPQASHSDAFTRADQLMIELKSVDLPAISEME